MFTTLFSQIGAVLMALVCGLAVWKGGAAERIAGGALALDWVACAALQDRRLHHHSQPAIFAIDVAYDLVLFALLSMRDSEWLIWAFAYQTLVVLTHIGAAALPYVGQWDFFLAYYVWSYGVLIAVAVGAAMAARRSDTGGRGSPALP